MEFSNDNARLDGVNGYCIRVLIVTANLKIKNRDVFLRRKKMIQQVLILIIRVWVK